MLCPLVAHLCCQSLPLPHDENWPISESHLHLKPVQQGYRYATYSDLGRAVAQTVCSLWPSMVQHNSFLVVHRMKQNQESSSGEELGSGTRKGIHERSTLSAKQYGCRMESLHRQSIVEVEYQVIDFLENRQLQLKMLVF